MASLARMALVKRRMRALVTIGRAMCATRRCSRWSSISGVPAVSCSVTTPGYSNVNDRGAGKHAGGRTKSRFLIALRKICKKSPLWILRF
ncbi:hypothetical protein M5585_16750 [Serratia ureilytica]